MIKGFNKEMTGSTNVFLERSAKSKKESNNEKTVSLSKIYLFSTRGNLKTSRSKYLSFEEEKNGKKSFWFFFVSSLFSIDDESFQVTY